MPSIKKCLHPQLFPIRLLPILLMDFSTMTHRIRWWIHLECAMSCWCPLPLNTPSAFSRWWLKYLPSYKFFAPSLKSQTNESACLLTPAAKSPFSHWSRDADKKGLDSVTCAKNSDRQEKKKSITCDFQQAAKNSKITALPEVFWKAVCLMLYSRGAWIQMPIIQYLWLSWEVSLEAAESWRICFFFFLTKKKMTWSLTFRPGKVAELSGLMFQAGRNMDNICRTWSLFSVSLGVISTQDPWSLGRVSRFILKTIRFPSAGTAMKIPG